MNHREPSCCAIRGANASVDASLDRSTATSISTSTRSGWWNRITRAALLVCLLLGVFAMQQAKACDGPQLIGSKVYITAMATNIDAEGVVGSSSKTSFFGFGRKKTVKDMPAEVRVGMMEMSCNAALVGSEIHINASANAIRLRGGKVRVGGLVLD